MKTRSATSNARRTLLRKGRDLLRATSRGRGRAKAADVMDMLDLRERQLLSSIHLALEKIERGIFGACDTCAERISEEQLEQEPWKLNCPECDLAAASPGPTAEDAVAADLS